MDLVTKPYTQSGTHLTMEKHLGADFIRRTRRKPLACVPCRVRKVKCDKNVPCGKCVARGNSGECHREVVIVKGVVANHESENTNREAFSSIKETLFNGKDVDNIRVCVERLTYGFIKVGKLFNTHYLSKISWPEFLANFENLMTRIDYSSSHTLCSFACYQINFIHNAVIPSLFMNEHEQFWNDHVKGDSSCLVYFNPSKLQSKNPKDYYFWMAMYYATICNGIFFGSKELEEKLNYTREELQDLGPMFFRAAYECLCRAHFMDFLDIRSIQIFCLLSTCFHAYGSVGQSQSLLAQCCEISRRLKLDDPNTTLDPTFTSEVKKRLWYTLCIIDWLDLWEKPYSHIPLSKVEMPLLITEEALLTPGPLFGEKISPHAYSSVYYQHVMVEMARIKKLLNSSPLGVVEGWTKVNKLRDTTLKFYEVDVPPLNNELLSYYHAKFLLFLSLTEEVQDYGRRILAIVGKSAWAAKYRTKCVLVALENLSRASLRVPSYYRKHWIVVQHHIYSALTVLLDMIMFPQKDFLMKDKEKFEQVEQLFLIFEELQSPHVPAKLGLAVLPRLCNLVRFVVEKKDGDVLEVISLKDFFDDLQVNRDPEISVPDLSHAQYFRLSDCKIEVDTGKDLLDSRVSDMNYEMDVHLMLVGSGWSEILQNIFNQELFSEQ